MYLVIVVKLIGRLHVEFVSLLSTGSNKHKYIILITPSVVAFMISTCNKYYLIYYSTASIRLWCI